MENQGSSISVSKALIYGAIIIALVIGGSYVYQKRFIEKNLPGLVKKAIQDMTPNPANAAPVTASDHLLGNAKAPVKLIVYTDLECPYCKVFHNSVLGLKDNYIKDGKIAVIYRNFPLDQLHSKARPEAIASECAAKLGGNDKYWAFVDKIFAATPSNNGLDLNNLPIFATELGLDKTAFANCLKDKTIADKVVAQETDGQKAGAQGTPYPIVMLNDVVKGALPGALPTDQLKKMVDDLLKAS
ncbi:MAG: thioredoxin domain-containing protein [Candidatus Vogelbacteria bacterium]|nr:thioredoxin domain-containing protein [Candidatus Vogelbacteria bacterium]